MDIAKEPRVQRADQDRPLNDCRLLVDPPAPGSWNMAVDEVLLSMAIDEKIATLRFYEWSAPTLSLGYFQNEADRHTHEPSRHCEVVRRSSGGGAILHDLELTYSLAVPKGHPMGWDARNLYQRVHQSLVVTLTSLLSTSEWRGTIAICRSDSDLSPSKQPFLCFERRSCGDLLWNPSASDLTSHKIAGSAQRRRQGAILQHGSVLLARSSATPELPGILELTGTRLSASELARCWQKGLAKALEVRLETQNLPSSAIASCKQLQQAKYASQAWTTHRLSSRRPPVKPPATQSRIK